MNAGRSPLLPLTVIAGIVAAAFAVVLIGHAVTGNDLVYVKKWGNLAQHEIVASPEGPAGITKDAIPSQLATPLTLRIDEFVMNCGVSRQGVVTVVNIISLLLAGVISAVWCLKARQHFIPALLATAVLTALSYPVLFLLERGTWDGVPALLLALTFCFWRGRSSSILGGVAFGLAVAFRWPLLVLLIPALLQRRWRLSAGAAAAILLVYLPWSSEWVEHIRNSSVGYWRVQANVSLPAFLYDLAELRRFRILDPVHFYNQLSVALAAVYAFVLVLLERSSSSKTDSGPPSAWIPIAILFPLLVEPSAQALILPLIPLLCAAYIHAARGWMRCGLIVAASGIALALLPAFALSALLNADWPQWSGAAGVLLLGVGLLIYRIESVFEACSAPLVARGTPARYESRTASPRKRSVARLSQFANHLTIVFRAFSSERKLCALLSMLMSAGVMLWYGLIGFHLLQLSLMFCAVLCAAMAWDRPQRLHHIPLHRRLSDLRAALLLAVLISPLYVVGVYWVPIQINTDELSIMHCGMSLNEHRPLDLFALEPAYFGFPSGCFRFVAFEAAMLGGVRLETMRIANGIHGILIVVAAFVFFRQFWPRRVAFVAALLLGFSHALIAISRMGARDNLPLLLEMLALSALVYGWRKQRTAWLVCGGAIAGLGVYNYFPARIIFIVWSAFVFTLFLRERFSSTKPLWSSSLRSSAALWLPALAGFVIVAGPMFINTYRAPVETQQYARQQIIVYPEGRGFLRYWEGKPTTWEAIASNTFYGLTAFNNNVRDRSNFYNNDGNGFVDPITGVLLWIGMLRLIWMKKRRSQHWLMLSSFLVIWLPMSLLLTKNPAYPRLLVVLPFVIMFATEGARALAFRIARLHKAGGMFRLRRRLLRVAVAGIALCNLRIYHEHYELGVKGDVAGDTIRYVDTKISDPDHAFYVLVGEQYTYFWWGREGWREWIETSARPPHKVEIIRTEDVLAGDQPRDLALPASVFMSRDMWEHSKEKFLSRYPRARIVTVGRSCEQLVLEVPREEKMTR